MIRDMFDRLQLGKAQLFLVTYGQVLGGAALLTGLLMLVLLDTSGWTLL